MADNSGAGIGSLNPFRYRGYFYDDETGWYYLKSRYYDPEVGRFINADTVEMLCAEQNNLLQFNLYTYCFNNPTYYYDNNGIYPQAIEDKMVHNWVLDDICDKNPELVRRGTCIYYNGEDYKDGWGYCDLYNQITGEVWELKKVSDSPSCTTAAAQVQLEKYIRGRLKRDLSLPLKRPSTTRISAGTFSKNRFGVVYNISYYNEGNGILRYKYTKKKTQNRETFENAVEKATELATKTAMIMFVLSPTGGLVLV